MYKIKNKNPEDYTALEIAVDFTTGERAGKISPRDKGLFCLSLWQDVDAGVEMRLILDDRNPAQYENIDGVTIHKGATTINDRVKQLFKTRYFVANTELFRESIKGMDIKDVRSNLSLEEQLKKCIEKGALGIIAHSPELVQE